ncbi:MAG TPA: hypothetical protein VFU88_00610 [Ktedonobacterales bacterium]|nr:hypothetical protein [Ktedonobacterales bacterium]
MPGQLPPAGQALPGQPATFAALQAMQAIILAECLVGGASPFAALSTADVARFGVASAVFIGRPKDFKDAYLPQCCLWIPEESETAALAGLAGRAEAELEARVRVFVDQRPDWYAAEQQILAIRDALWPAMLRHERLGGIVPTVIASEARTGRGLCYEQVAGNEYRCYEAGWWVRQQWSIAGGKVM